MHVRLALFLLLSCRAVWSPSLAGAQQADSSTLASLVAARLVVMRIPIPGSLREAASRTAVPLRWRAIAGTGVRLLGADSGEVAPEDSLVRLTVQRAPTLRGGHHLAATVQFALGDVGMGTRRLITSRDAMPRTAIVHELRVPLDVPALRRMSVRDANGSVRPVVRGAWNELPMEMINDGNVAEVVRLAVDLPQGWRARPGRWGDAVVVRPGMPVTRRVPLWVPESWPTGQWSLPVRWRATPLGQTAAAAAAAGDSLQPLRLDVHDAVGTIPGPRAELATMAVQAGDGGRAAGAALTLSGPLTPDVTVDARLAMGGTRGGGAALGLARSGLVSAPPQLTLTARNRTLSLGTVQGTGALLAGAFLTGTGAAARWEAPRGRLALYGARPFSFIGGQPWSAGTGVLTGGAVDRRWGATRLGVEGAHLRDPLAGRALDAALFSGGFASPNGGVLDGALAWRRHAAGQGAGVLGSYRRAGERSTMELRLVHAPGGSRAFARAAQEVELSASRRLPLGATLAGGGWQQGDDGGVLGRLRSNGWYLAPSIPIGARAALASVDLRQSALRTSGVGGVLAHDEQQLAALLSAERRGTTVGVRASLVAVRRTVGVEGLPPVVASGQRLEWRGTIGTWLPGGGRFDGAWMVQGGTGDAGVAPRQQALSARIDRVPLPGLSHLPVTLQGDGQWMIGAASRNVWMARGAIRVALPMGGALAIQLERAPFLSTSRGGGVVYGLRLEQRTGLPSLRSARTHVAFLDANANGRRDNGEAGVTGVVVQCGDRSTVSDAAGRIQCPDGLPLQVDARTLPDGVLPPRGDRRGAHAGGDPLALRPVRAAVVQLVPLETDTFRLKPAALTQALVMARGDDGTRWTARPMGDGRFILDAMPPGRYQLEVELADIAEPLQLAAPLPQLTITAGEAPPPVVIPLRTRPVRITPQNAPGGRALAPGAARQERMSP